MPVHQHGRDKSGCVKATGRRLTQAYRAVTQRLAHYKRRTLAGLFLFALMLRLAYLGLFVGFASPPEYDGFGYNWLAEGLLAGRGYVNYWGEPTAFRPPVYPLFLAGVYAITGHSLAAVRLLQALLDSVTVLLVYGTARQLFGGRVALLAGLGTALYPLLIYETGLIIPETLSYTLQFAAIVLLLQMRTGGQRALPLLNGLLIGLTVLARPTAALWALLILLWIIWPGLLRRRWEKLALTAAGLAVVFAPWVLRNALALGAFVPISSNGAVNIWCGNNPLADGGSVQPTQKTWNGADYPTRGLYGWEGLSEVESNQRFADQGLTWMRENPAAFARLIPRKLFRLWSPVSYSVQFGRQASGTLVSLALPPYLAFLALAFAGIYHQRRAWRQTFPLLAIIISINLMVIPYYGATRYGIPMVMALIIFAAAALDRTARAATHGVPQMSQS